MTVKAASRRSVLGSTHFHPHLMLQMLLLGSQNQQPVGQFSSLEAGVCVTACFRDAAALNQPLKEEERRTPVGSSLFAQELHQVCVFFHHRLLLVEVEARLRKTVGFYGDQRSAELQTAALNPQSCCSSDAVEVPAGPEEMMIRERSQ